MKKLAVLLLIATASYAQHPITFEDLAAIHRVATGVWPLYEVEEGVLKLKGKTKQIAEGRSKRLPVREYLLKQGRFAHFTDDDLEYFQSKVDEMWEKWLIPGVIPFRKDADTATPVRDGGNGSA